MDVKSAVDVKSADVDSANVDSANVSPVDVSPVDVSPVDVSPVDVSPVDVSPVDVAAVGGSRGCGRSPEHYGHLEIRVAMRLIAVCSVDGLNWRMKGDSFSWTV